MFVFLSTSLSIYLYDCQQHISHWLCMQEEYEDSQGNILNRKMYDLLKKQGVL